MITGPIDLPLYFQDTKDAISAKDISRKEPVDGVIALKESMKYFDADFFNDSKVITKGSLIVFKS